MKRILIAICAVAAVISAGSCQREEEYLVRETDAVRFDTPRENKRKITLRCVGAWKTIVPQGAEWISTTPSEGVGDGSMEFIYVNAAVNRGAERTATIYLENGGKQYPITVSQVDGAIVWGELTLAGDIIEGETVSATLHLPYSNTIGDENVEVTCAVSGTVSGLEISPVSVQLDADAGKIEIPVSGTPSGSGNITVTASVEGVEVASAVVKVYGADEKVLEGLPVQWTFSPIKATANTNPTSSSYSDRFNKNWTGSNHYIVSDSSADARITLVDNSAGADVQQWAVKDGHIYVKGLYLEDYWLMTVPVKNLMAGKTVGVSGSVGGAGTSPVFFLLEYSVDGVQWTACEDSKQWTGSVGDNQVTAEYHILAMDSMLQADGAFSVVFTVPSTISDGNLYIRARVNANVNINTFKDGKTAGTINTNNDDPASTRLKGTWKVAVVENNQ